MVVEQRKDYEEAMKQMFQDFPVCNQPSTFKEFVSQIHEQSQYLMQDERLSLIKDSFDSSGGSNIQELKKKIRELESSVKSKDLRIDADSRIMRQQKDMESQLKKLRAEMTLLQVEKNKELQMQKDSFEETIISL